jgi:hypothetical protein
MADEPTKEDVAKLDAKIKELSKRAEALDASADEINEAAKAVETESKVQSKELGSIKQRKK